MAIDTPRGFVTIDDCCCTAATKKALLITIEGEEIWIPMSQLHDDSECYGPGKEGTIVIPEWLAAEKGLLE